MKPIKIRRSGHITSVLVLVHRDGDGYGFSEFGPNGANLGGVSSTTRWTKEQAYKEAKEYRQRLRKEYSDIN